MGELLATNITVLSVVHGDYFERFGTAFFQSLESAQCENAILVSDKLVPVPSFVTLIIKDFTSQYDFCNTANKALDSDWGLHMGFDDLLLPGALEPIDSEADVYGWPQEYRGLLSGFATYKGGFEDMPNLTWNPMVGGWAYKRDLLKEIPFRNYLYFDEVHFCELSYFGKTIEYSTRPRSTWLRHEGGHSMYPNELASEQVRQFRAKLRAGEIVKGVSE